MNTKTVVMTALSIGILIAAIALAYNIFSSKDVAQPLTTNVVELRNSVGDPVRKAKLVSNIDDLASYSTEAVQDHWAYMTECLPAGCADDEYLNMVLIISQEQEEEMPQAEVITNVVVAHRFWGGEDVVEFSRALSKASDSIDLIKSKQVRSKWNEIVECNGECSGMNDLFFEMILLLLK